MSYLSGLVGSEEPVLKMKPLACMLVNLAAKRASHSRKGLEGVAFAVTKLMADTRDPESFEASEPSKEIEHEDDCGCGYAALYSCVRFGVKCRRILQNKTQSTQHA